MASERYIRECDYYFLVAPIARVQTDDAVHRRLKQAHKLNSKRALITTKIDVSILTMVTDKDNWPSRICPQLRNLETLGQYPKIQERTIDYCELLTLWSQRGGGC